MWRILILKIGAIILVSFVSSLGLDSPICQKQQVVFHGAAPNEKVDIPCFVEAHPKPQRFYWTFNNSGESVKIPKVQ